MKSRSFQTETIANVNIGSGPANMLFQLMIFLSSLVPALKIASESFTLLVASTHFPE